MLWNCVCSGGDVSESGRGPGGAGLGESNQAQFGGAAADTEQGLQPSAGEVQSCVNCL